MSVVDGRSGRIGDLAALLYRMGLYIFCLGLGLLSVVSRLANLLTHSCILLPYLLKFLLLSSFFKFMRCKMIYMVFDNLLVENLEVVNFFDY